MQLGFVPEGVAHVSVVHDGPPAQVIFLLLPRFSLLAFSSAIEVLRIANQLASRPLFAWRVVSTDGQPVASSAGLVVQADAPMGDVPAGAMAFACAGVRPELSASAAAADWLRRAYRQGEVVGGLCSGAYALARAGLLAGRRFTLHWENIAPFAASHPRLTPCEQLYCMDGRIWTCAGGSAAADLFTAMLRRRHGDRLADTVLSMSLHGHQRQGDQRQRRVLPQGIDRNSRLGAMLREMDDDMAGLTEVGDLAERYGMSRRQMERLFRQHLGQTPHGHLTALRVERARALIQETDLSRAEIAGLCGFSDSRQMMRHLGRVDGAAG